MQKGNRVPRSAYHEWHHLFFFPEWTALSHKRAVHMLLPEPLASAKDCTPQKSNTAFLDFEISMRCDRKRKMGFLLVNQYFFVTFG